MRETIKRAAGAGVAAVCRQCTFETCIFVIAHMRCGSTALSNILCSRSDLSGYGEAHIRYDGPGALGRLVVNQALRGVWAPAARGLFDKILHDRHDAAASPEFFAARAIFVARTPSPAIRSIRRLYDRLGRNEYDTDTKAADYYVRRLSTISALWDRFAPERRVALTHTALMADPQASLDRISARFALDPPLQNRYDSAAASRRGGGGDPFDSGMFDRIVARSPGTDAPAHLDIDPALGDAAEARYAEFEALALRD
ncbi:hypothetical protein ROJ8625_00105 [Roseivivax jejudonensis]|uniref:Sulfotransferase family protein n=1 Tax=Roseivivax jejudonensis TaxID=1529041 RepID=A0A1X6Y391_9RHOB|nr:sulfotransferase family protein [Roseivivax jejudonensis]SLN09819.1 hypothetical protein ROJ8625_00105 [Roseivivax jejudonensis]